MSTIPSNIFWLSRFLQYLAFIFLLNLTPIIFGNLHMLSNIVSDCDMCQLLTTGQPQLQSDPELFPLKNLSIQLSHFPVPNALGLALH